MPTGAALVAFHPDVAVVLGDPGLRIQEWQADASLSTQASIVAAALLNSLLIELVAQSAGRSLQLLEIQSTNSSFQIHE